MQRINSSGWNIDQYNLYARGQTEKVEQEISRLNSEIRTTAGLVFRDPEVMLKLARADLDDTLRRLELDPKQIGRLRGDTFNKAERTDALKQAGHLRALLLSRADQHVVLERYEKMHLNCLEAGRRPQHEWAATCEILENERQYCDTTREVRNREQRERLSPYQEEREDDRSVEPAAERVTERAEPKEWWQQEEHVAPERAAKETDRATAQQDRTFPETSQNRQTDYTSPPRAAVVDRPLPDQAEPVHFENAWWRTEASVRAVPHTSVPEYDRRTQRVSDEWEQKRLREEERQRERSR